MEGEEGSTEAILPLAQSPKLEPGDYGDLLKALKKVRVIITKSFTQQ